MQRLTEARITAQQARSAETLDLVRRQPADANTFEDAMESVRRSIDEATENDRGGQSTDDAITALEEWRRGHVEMRSRLDVGDYAGAVDVATVEGTPPHSSADAFEALDASLQTAIAEARLDLRGEIEGARQASALLSALVVLLSIAAAIAVVFGFRNPLLEYL